tara:strand:+ start:1870 stop:2088 length:219 start_codon:yes stop_codon:yes gene_type:complete
VIYMRKYRYGKTIKALEIATQLIEEIAYIDTEHGIEKVNAWKVVVEPAIREIEDNMGILLSKLEIKNRKVKR